MGLVLVLLLSVMVGMNAGLTATTLDEATIEAGEDYDLLTVDEYEEPEPGAIAEHFPDIETPLDPYVNAFVVQLTNSLLVLAMTIASGVSVLTYQHAAVIRPLVPALDALFSVVAIALTGAMTLVSMRPLLGGFR